MMQEKLNAAFIDVLQQSVPEHTNLANLLSEVLNIGREAAYRRLRGEVLFTLPEAAVLGAHLNISLDYAMGKVGARSVIFQLNFTDYYSMLAQYAEILGKDMAFFRGLTSDRTAVFATAGSQMPAEFYMRYEYMTRFKFFRWLYQHGLVDHAVRQFEDMQIPQSLSASCAGYVDAVQQVATTYYVMDAYGFVHWVTAIRAFRAMGLISQESIRILVGELFDLLDTLEQIMIKAQYPNGHKVSFYLSDIDLESTYSYISTERVKSSSVGVFSLNTLRTSDPTMFEHANRWIQTQMRFATLISGSGELRRIRYINRQREILHELEREGLSPSLEAALD